MMYESQFPKIDTYDYMIMILWNVIMTYDFVVQGHIYIYKKKKWYCNMAKCMVKSQLLSFN